MILSTIPAAETGQLELLPPSNWTEYAQWVDANTDKRARGFPVIYPLSGLATEGGECGAFVEKCLRFGGDYYVTPEIRDKIVLEAGDVLYYLTKLANDLGTTLEEFRDRNVTKLTDRRLNGKH